ncbi:MAG TPA: group 1 truncated hemoglobin [Tepidisphaeraceae bacterium]|jgi:hemoglobin
MVSLNRLSIVMLAALFVGAFSGCENWNKKEETVVKPLYDRLGGEPAIRAVVDDFVTRAAADPKVNFTRKGVPGREWDATPTNVEHLKKMLVEFIAVNTGGPQKYSGRDMRTTHKGMMITNAEFDAIAADLKASLDALKVPAQEQSELMAIVGTTRKDIVEVK